ncbi:MAG: YitT family protein [Ruminococcus flavefaciens]|nr:YitT family protein [Ruminococcus flavefaciens]MCM1361172.1 YitT family protein [Clostridiales bacterium]MCM1434664.1 YitT family protein [Ruminococcus flavefaciens]
MKKFFESIKPFNLIMLTVAGMINAFGITLFLMPVKLYDSGISGTSMLLAQVTPQWLSLSIFLILLNVPLFLYGLKKQGKTFTFYAIYTVIIYSVTSWLITDILPVDVSLASPLAGTDLLLCALFGGVISGTGSGLAIRFGGAMDGIEVMAVIFAKRLGLSVGSFVMIYNIILYIICGIVINSWILPLYSIVTYYAALKTIDFIVDGLQRSKAAMIITSKPDKICKQLMDEFSCGVTIIDAKGGFSGTERSALYFVVNRFQVMRMKDIVQKIDPLAYITLSEVADIFSANHSK